MAQPLPKLIKRRPYNDYSKYKDEIPDILNRLINTKRGDIATVSEQTGIPFSTLSRWHQSLRKNTRFNPLERKWGAHRRIFTDAEEDSLADFIVENYIIPGYHFTDEDFRQLALEAYKEKYIPLLGQNSGQYKEFRCSDGFISDFKYHHKFRSKTFHLKRRSKPYFEEQS